MDIMLIALADVRRDARTLNAARALASAGYRVGILAAGSLRAEAGITLYPWNDPGGRAWRRWQSLTRAAAALDVRPRVIGAMDFFAMQAALLLRRRCDARIVYDAREFYFALGPLQGRGWRQRVLSWLESRYVRRANVITVSGPLDADVLANRYRLRDRPAVILNAPPYADAVASTLLRERAGVPGNALVLLYQGVVHHGRGLMPLLDAMPLMSDVHLCVIGDGPALQELQHAAAARGLSDRVHWLGSMPYDDLHAWTCGADIGVTLIEDVSMSYAYALPNKFFEYMRARIPQIVSDLPALHDMIQRYPVGLLVESALRPAAIVDAVDRLRRSETRDAFAAQCDAIRDVCYERQASVLLDVYASQVER
ncbi:MAG: glycosyltransferase family 4 protein [Candidatus Kapabacteria bacterium]|nr:glycosyltransferase family 4 protein [Candidatus Kapabacteria bacterium]